MKNPLPGEPELDTTLMKQTTSYFLQSKRASLPENQTVRALRESTSLEFHRTIGDYKPSPVVELPSLAIELGIGNLFLKDESHRFGLNAFKGLGASYAIHKLLERDPEISTFCTATDGNHGRAVAWSARLFGKKARVFVPVETTRARIEAIENEGAIVEQLEEHYDKTCAHAARISREKGWQLVQDTAWEGYEEIPAWIKAGYLTHFRELETSLHGLPKVGVDVVFLQAGVGSWPASAAWYYHNRFGSEGPSVVLVEPRESSGILQSFRKGERTEPKGRLDSIMAGLNCGIPSSTAWKILRATTDAAMEIEDSWAENAIRRLYYPTGGDPRITAGESGAGGMAGLIAMMTDPRFEGLKQALEISSDSRILVYSTEGATDPENFRKIIKRKV